MEGRKNFHDVLLPNVNSFSENWIVSVCKQEMDKSSYRFKKTVDLLLGLVFG